MKYVLLLIILPVLLLASPQYIHPNENTLTDIERWFTHVGDSIVWASPDSPTYDWDTIAATKIWKSEDGHGKGIRWYRTDLFFPEPLPPQEGLSLYIPALLTSYEIFWDGKKVGTSGKVSDNPKEEINGKSGQIITLTPDQCAPGRHTIAIRVSNFNNLSGAIPTPISIGATSRVIHLLFQKLGTSLFLGGIFAITALFHLFIVGGRKNRYSHILFSLFALSCGGHILVSSLLGYGEISLGLYYPLAFAGDFFWFGMIAFLPIFLLSHFTAHVRHLTGGIILAVSLLVVLLPRLALYDIVPIRFLSILNDLNLFYAYLSVLVSIGVVIGSTVRKRKGSKTILVGMLIFLTGLIITTLFGITNGWSIGFAFLNIFITIAISRQFSEERKQYYKSELKASRLELELLKKHIQPHFLLNSLNSIVAWIEEEPEIAAKLVNALSQELRLLMAFAGERTINLSQEIKICKVHLEVMSMRQEKQFVFNLEGIKEGIQIPPFIIHTLIENGISHGFRRQEEGIFTLTTERQGNDIVISLHNNGDNKSRPVSESKGTGTRYIRSRLQELYGTKYSFSSKSTSDGWLSTIRFSGENK